MKIKVLKTAYFNQKLLNIGEIVDFKGKKIPSWATLADGIETKKTKSEAKDDNKNGKKEEKTSKIRQKRGKGGAICNKIPHLVYLRLPCGGGGLSYRACLHVEPKGRLR